MFKREELLEFIKDRFKLDWSGIHGIPHWARVHSNGRKLCEKEPEADPLVVELFAWLHDIERVNDGPDENHGPRAAILIVEELLGVYFDLDEQQAEDLILAVRDHSAGLAEGNATIRVCWDSDRLDLGRVGVLPDPTRLCTEHGKTAEMIRWSQDRAITNHFGIENMENIKY